MPSDAPTPSPPSDLLLTSLSRLLGWSYTLLWSLSFYPQVIINFRTHSVRGLSSDYVLLNLLGHSCYAVYNLLYLVSSSVREEYRQKWGRENAVQWNDAAFAVHAAVVSAVTAGQWWRYRTEMDLPPVPRSRPTSRYSAVGVGEPLFPVQQEQQHQAAASSSSSSSSAPPPPPPASHDRPRSYPDNSNDDDEDEDAGPDPDELYDARLLAAKQSGETVSLPTRLFLVCTLTALVASLGLLNLGSLRILAFVDLLGWTKLVVTLVKYLPQIVLNARRRSTDGFSIENVVLDASGGVLSLLQLLVDSERLGDWKSAVGDVGKLGLSLLSIGYDLILMTQHYILYRHSRPTTATREEGGTFSFLFSSFSSRPDTHNEEGQEGERRRLLA